MKKLKYTVSNIFRASNLGTIVFFLLNFFILCALFAPAGGGEPTAYLSMLLLYVLSLALSFSTIGQKALCFVNGAKRMARADMRSRVLPIVSEVFLAAKRKTPELPDRINVRIMYDPNPNAFAIGTNTICVTEGMLDMPENLMAGIIAHEIGHLAHQHTVIQMLIGGGNILISGVILMLELIRSIFSFGSAVGTAVGTASRSEGSLFYFVGAFFAAISAGMIFLWTKFCMLLLMGSSRANEYAADRYAFDIGYGDDLAEALDRLTMGTPQATLLKMLTSSHPEPGDRIGRLQEMGSTYSRY